jgi:hypothetical protein
MHGTAEAIVAMTIAERGKPSMDMQYSWRMSFATPKKADATNARTH